MTKAKVVAAWQRTAGWVVLEVIRGILNMAALKKRGEGSGGNYSSLGSNGLAATIAAKGAREGGWDMQQEAKAARQLG